jgi:hypothetical protein
MAKPKPPAISPERMRELRDLTCRYVCRDCRRGVTEDRPSETGYRHREHLPGEPDWQCPRTPLPPVAVRRG